MKAASARLLLVGVSIAIFSILIMAGCYSPADNTVSGSARLELRLPETSEASGFGRAVAGSGGFLYVRAIGGSSGDTGPSWGPIPVSGRSVIISDIAPGEYSDILVLHSSVEFNDESVTLDPQDGYAGGEATFADLLAVPDAYLPAYIGQPAGESVVLSQFLQGAGSYGLTGRMTIRPGINTLAATLVPACSGDQESSLSQEGDQYDGGIYGSTGRFFKVGFDEDPSWSSVYFLANTDGDDVPLSFYTTSGKRIGMVYSPAEYAYRGTIPLSAFPIYVYKPVEHTNTTALTVYEGNLPAEIAGRSFTGAPITSGYTLMFGSVTSGMGTLSQTIDIINGGTQPLVISSMTITGANPASYSVSPAAPFTVPPAARVLAVSALFLFAACQQPADNSRAGYARIEIAMPDAAASDTASRAIAGPGGYLYVRAFGEAAGGSSRFWGPLSASGKSVIISDVEPGEYSAFFVLHSSHDIDENSFYTWETASNPDGGAAVSLRALMEYPDNVFRDYASPTDGNESIFANPVMSRGSMAMTGPVLVRPGINSLAVTLVPLTNSDTNLVLADNNGQSYSTVISDESPQFFRLSFPSEGPQWGRILFSMNADNLAVPCRFYTSSGRSVSGVSFDASDDTYRGTVAMSAFPLYVYIGSFAIIPNFIAYEGGVPAEISVQVSLAYMLDNGGELGFDDVTYSSQTNSTEVTINNNGTDPLVVSSMIVTGANPSSFFVADGAPLTVPGRSSRTVSVGFRYTVGAGPRSATLTINSNSASNGSFVLFLSGNVSDE